MTTMEATKTSASSATSAEVRIGSRATHVTNGFICFALDYQSCQKRTSNTIARTAVQGGTSSKSMRYSTVTERI